MLHHTDGSGTTASLCAVPWGLLEKVCQRIEDIIIWHYLNYFYYYTRTLTHEAWSLCIAGQYYFDERFGYGTMTKLC